MKQSKLKVKEEAVIRTESDIKVRKGLKRSCGNAKMEKDAKMKKDPAARIPKVGAYRRRRSSTKARWNNDN